MPYGGHNLELRPLRWVPWDSNPLRYNQLFYRQLQLSNSVGHPYLFDGNNTNVEIANIIENAAVPSIIISLISLSLGNNADITMKMHVIKAIKITIASLNFFLLI